ncbi:MAG: hypothetical protein JST14_09090 [Bacteroidetes bacterium]|nr:hypothetical protein [Bacteroidota bacterium]MBS1979124.1 hypothetical protein [Bacteroidota bacterium]
MRKCLTLFSLICSAANLAFGQTEGTLYFMNSLPQVVEANPAIMPRYKMSIGLPVISSVAAIYTNNGFTYNNLATKTNGVVTANLSNWVNSLAQQNYIQLTAQADLLRFGMRIKPRTYIMFSSTLKGYNRSMIEKGLAALLVDGTAPIVGTYSNTSPQEEAVTYLSTSMGIARQINSKFTIGGRLKYLVGINNITTESSSLVVQVSDTYQITATGDARVRSSGIASLNKSNSSVNLGDYFKNSGLGVDIGATYKLDKLTLGFSLNDIGFITWKNDTQQYTLDPASAKYTFSGIDVNKLLNNNKDYISSQLDSIQNKFKMKETSSGSYTTMLPAKAYLSGSYEIINNLSVGALFFTEAFRGRYASGMTAAVNKNFGKWVSTSLTYTVSNRSYNNIGLGVSFNVTPVQIYFVGDNLLKAPASLISDQNLNSYLNSSQLLTLRAGINIGIGWDKGAVSAQKVADQNHNPKEDNNAKVRTTLGSKPKSPTRNRKPTNKSKTNTNR